MKAFLMAALAAALLASAPAHAKHHHYHHRASYDANGNGVVSGRPAGCPYQFCGCEASLYLFGRIIPPLNLASNWIARFERTSPAPRMAAARNHHVMVLVSHISGNDWLVHDGNSGGHKTREHVRSIVGYVIVDPNRPRFAVDHSARRHHTAGHSRKRHLRLARR